MEARRVIIDLQDHQPYAWSQYGNLSFRCGFLPINPSGLLSCANVTEAANEVARYNGCFAAIMTQGEELWLVADKYRSFPLLYRITDTAIEVLDSVRSLRGGIVDDTLYEFIAMGVVMGGQTLFEGYHQVEAGQIVRIERTSGNVSTRDYYLHHHTEDAAISLDELRYELDKRIEGVFDRAVDRAGNRTIVVPLSGGYDSRLVVENLQRRNARLTCISYGSKRNKEVQVAQRLAGELGVDWRYVEQTGLMVEAMTSQPSFWPSMREVSCGTTMPYLQNYVIGLLVQDGSIPPDAIVMTGNSGDLVEGDQMPEAFGITGAVTREQILWAIKNKHYRLAGPRGASIPEVEHKVCSLYLTEEQYSAAEAHDVYERFNWRERQSKFLRCEGQLFSDWCGLEWHYPLWDDEFVEFWLHLPTKLRFRRSFYYDYVGKEQIYSANDTTLRTRALDFAKRHAYWVLKKLYKAQRRKEWNGGDSLWHLMSHGDFERMLSWTSGVGTNSDTAKIWSTLRHCYGIDVACQDFSKYKDFHLM